MTLFARRAATLALAGAALGLAGCGAVRSVTGSAPAVDPAAYSGYLCCNLRTDGRWASDSNYAENGKRVIPVGTPMQVTGFGRNRVNVLVNGTEQSIGNDYSRDLDDAAFANRWVVRQDPKAQMASYSPKVREAIESARVSKGMTRKQVFMAYGYPISSENPNLDAPVLRYWLSSFAPVTVMFDKAGRVQQVDTDPATRYRVVME